jgi:hypothetical protein
MVKGTSARADENRRERLLSSARQRNAHNISAKVLAALEDAKDSQHSIFARVLLIADNDSVAPSALPALHLLPGKKFRLVVSVSVASVIPKEMTPLRLVWNAPPQRASLMTDLQSDKSKRA